MGHGSLSASKNSTRVTRLTHAQRHGCALMVSALRAFWQWVSDFGIPEGTSPDERKLFVSANQLMMATLILIGLMSLSLLLIWLVLMRIDFAFYRNYFWGGVPPVVSLICGGLIFFYRGRSRQFYGPLVFFAYLMTLLTAAVTVTFGGYYGLEYWVLVIMGMGIFVLHKKPVLRRTSVILSLVLFIGLRWWIANVPELLPVPHALTRTFYFILTSLALFIMLLLEFRFIAQQSAKAEDAFIAQRDLADKLLLNIMPQSVAEELKAKGKYEPRHYDSVTVLFTDFVGFTKLAAGMSPHELLASLETCFSAFDRIVQKHGLEKLKTIGDSYMCAAGIPTPVVDHAERAASAALDFLAVVKEQKMQAEKKGKPYWDIRIGLHTGPLVAGIIGDHKFAYDIWGDTVNVASRMESAGEVGRINLSAATAKNIGPGFEVRSRGVQNAKSIGETEMFELVAATSRSQGNSTS